jgi:hypothetical protein
VLLHMDKSARFLFKKFQTKGIMNLQLGTSQLALV